MGQLSKLNMTEIDSLNDQEFNPSGPLYDTVPGKDKETCHSPIGIVRYVAKNNNLSPDQIHNLFRNHDLVVVPKCPQGYRLSPIVTRERVSEVFGVDLHALQSAQSVSL